MNQYFNSKINALTPKNVDDIINLEKVYKDLLKEYEPQNSEDIILLNHLSILYVRLGRSWAAEIDLLNRTRGGVLEFDFSEVMPITDYGADKLELILTRYEPAILKSIAKTRSLLQKRRKNLSNFLKMHNVAEVLSGKR